MSLHKKIFINTQPHLNVKSDDKISVIGAGNVGMAVAISILNREITRDLVLLDVFGDDRKVKGEILDLQHAAVYLKHRPRISGGNSYEATKDSKLCIITAGSQQIPGESKLNLTQRNADIMVKLIPELVRHSPETLLLVVSHPCDIMSYVAWKSSGLPTHKVIGAGSVLDSARFRVNLSKKLQTNPSEIDAYIIGEHGENSIPIWSTLNLSGRKLRVCSTHPENDPTSWMQCHKNVTNCNQLISELKGYSNWGIGISVAEVARTILTNKFGIFPVSVNAKGKYGISEDVYVTLPSVLASNGVTDVVELSLNENEMASLKNTAKLMKNVQDGINLGSGVRRCNCTRCKKLSQNQN